VTVKRQQLPKAIAHTKQTNEPLQISLGEKTQEESVRDERTDETVRIICKQKIEK